MVGERVWPHGCHMLVHDWDCQVGSAGPSPRQVSESEFDTCRCSVEMARLE